MKVCFVFAFLALTAAGAQQPRDATVVQAPVGTARIYGRVVAADTGEPVRAASVNLADPSVGTWIATTDDDGRFDIRALPPGRFKIRVDKPTFLRTTFPLFAQSSQGLDLKAEQQVNRGDLKLPRGGAIAGRVVDERGDPVVDANVRAWRVEYPQPGTRRLGGGAAAGGSWFTNDQGEFRIYGLRPGKYLLSAGFSQWQVAVNEPGKPATQFVGSIRGPLTTFYPGVALADDALAIGVEAGATASGIGIRVLSAVLAKVGGRVVDSQGRPAQRVALLLNSARADGLSLGLSLTGVDADGRFLFSNVAPGDYRIDVDPQSRYEEIGRTGTVGRQDGQEFASRPLTVNGDVTDLMVQTGLGYEVSGRIFIDGALPPASVLKALQVDALPMSNGRSIPNTVQTGGGAARLDGSFVVKGLMGSRLIRVSGLPPGTVIKSILARGAEITDEGLDVDHDVAGVDIQLTTKPAGVNGVVTDAAGSSTRDYAVIVFPEDSRRWTIWQTRYVVSAMPRDDGTFQVPALPPGRYLAVAVAELEDGQWPAPDNLERLRQVAAPFTLGEGETRRLTLVRK